MTSYYHETYLDHKNSNIPNKAPGKLGVFEVYSFCIFYWLSIHPKKLLNLDAMNSIEVATLPVTELLHTRRNTYFAFTRRYK